jgi:hypothetical protein
MLAEKSSTPYYYPIAVDLEYRLLSHQTVVKTGHGRTVEISSTCVHFEPGDALPVGSTVEIFIAWPALLNNTVSLRLYIAGRTISSQHQYTAIEVQRHEFRTRRAEACAESTVKQAQT